MMTELRLFREFRTLFGACSLLHLLWECVMQPFVQTIEATPICFFSSESSSH